MDPADVIDLKDVAVTALEESFTARKGRIRGMLLPQKKSVNGISMGVSKNRGTPKMDGLNWKTLLKWMIWGYHHFRKPPYK